MRITKIFASLLGLTMAALLAGCNSDSDDSASVNDAGVGSVAVILTDAPIDDFDQFLLTVTEISLLGEDGKISIFSGSERLDLLDLDSHADLFSLADNIPSGDYHKIRMRIANPLLLRLDADGNVLESVVPEMSGHGKLDLNPRSDLHVLPGETLALQIDLDANKSIHLIQQGNGAYRFRPVIFVDVLTDDSRGKLLRVAGFVGDINDDGFELCRTGMAVEDNDRPTATRSHRDSHRNGHDDDENEREEEDDEYEHDDHERCIQVSTDADTAYFNDEGSPLRAVTLTAEEPVTVLGYYRNLGHHPIGLNAEVVELATKGTYQQYPGLVDELDLDNNAFTLRDSDDNLLTVEFGETSKFFAMTGEPLSIDDLNVGDEVKVEGVLIAADDTIKAAAIFIDIDVPDVAQLSGTISLRHDDLLGFDMTDAALGDVCIRVNDSSNYYLLTLMDGSFSSEEVGYADLHETQHVEVYGEFNLSGCYLAENILAEALR